jgi:hypothetical protein
MEICAHMLSRQLHNCKNPRGKGSRGEGVHTLQASRSGFTMVAALVGPLMVYVPLPTRKHTACMPAVLMKKTFERVVSKGLHACVDETRDRVSQTYISKLMMTTAGTKHSPSQLKIKTRGGENNNTCGRGPTRGET